MTAEDYKIIKLESNYLEDYRTAIRSKTIPWDGFARSELLTQLEAKRLTQLESAIAHKKLSTIIDGDELEDYTSTLVSLISRDLPAERADITKYLLVLISDLLVTPEFIAKLVLLNKTSTDSVLLALVKYINSSDEIIKLLALFNLSSLLIQPTGQPQDETIVSKSFTVLNSLIESTSFNLQFLSLELITELLSVKEYRPIFWQNHTKYVPNLFQSLNSHLQYNTTETVQFQYKILLCIWLLSFNTASLKDFSHYYLSEFLSFIQLVKISIKEKVIRLVISIIINLTTIPGNASLSTENLKYFILTGEILPTLSNLKERKWSDEELIDDLDTLYGNVQEVYSKLTSFDEYLQELAAKSFKNSPVHGNDEFFLDNLHYFQDSNYKIFKQLIGLLDVSMEPKSYVHLLSDIGKILKLDSKAIDVLTKEQKKTQIMALLSHKNSEVRYEALKATQFIVSQTFR